MLTFWVRALLKTSHLFKCYLPFTQCGHNWEIKGMAVSDHAYIVWDLNEVKGFCLYRHPSLHSHKWAAKGRKANSTVENSLFSLNKKFLFVFWWGIESILLKGIIPVSQLIMQKKNIYIVLSNKILYLCVCQKIKII